MRPVPVEPAPDLKILNCLLFLDWCSAFAMRVRAGLASAQLTFFAGFRAAGRTANRQLFLRLDFHSWTLRRLAPGFWSIVTSTQSIFVEY
jgi:hypothetical protein